MRIIRKDVDRYGRTVAEVYVDDRLINREMVADAAGLSSFPGAKCGSTKQLRAKDRPLANDKMSGAAFDKLLAA